VGYKTGVVLYDRKDRAGGEGKLTFLSRIKYAMDAITSFSYKPLRLSFGLAGFAISVAVILALCTVFSKSAVNPLGYGVAAAIFLVGGFLLLCVGVLGEYLGRVYDEVRSRPLSIINKVYGPPHLISSEITMNRRIGDRRKPFRVA
jgi:dolichol-phosphate mannosyltransferase